ncbi:twin-arginine translocase TatA/TatE family subunit [Candidatus Methylospira mobilis]|uniref:Sec-independent protein translocase protein TatA n=1 Tax=Candidatus Methylospira mobilis TaxID=1808979 RepID=A0A5Q0BQ85_9GAMM|nr:twin-arginine translocase TatA/TatE family subunit [Candidatus Methylospira mobilis]QFY43866.1 twin-arginine translocase TatA/TatE family subunit [Candidatus Methylospira mobilis]WNV04865.1 twin-arginine translocase TatA/TatE family subunit [Candidatus Methylospira mobilis]
MGIGIWELVLLFLIVLLVFGTKRLRSVGGDLGSAIRSFRSAMHEEPGKQEESPAQQAHTIDGEAHVEKK